MNTNVKFASVALAAALVGGSAGSALTSWRSEAAPAPAPAPATTQKTEQAAAPVETPDDLAAIELEPADAAAPTSHYVAAKTAPAATRTVARASTARAAAPAPARTRARTVTPRRVYYDYSQPNVASAPASYNYNPPKKNFWQKHRDLLTVGIGAGTGAAIGGATGGKKGALIGTGVGAGASALYTYVLRNRNND
jgi:hypothetical protein